MSNPAHQIFPKKISMEKENPDRLPRDLFTDVPSQYPYDFKPRWGSPNFRKGEEEYMRNFMESEHGTTLLENEPVLFTKRLMMLMTLELKAKEYKRRNFVSSYLSLLFEIAVIFLFVGMGIGNVMRAVDENGSYCGDNAVEQLTKCVIVPALLSPIEVPVRAGIKFARDQSFERN